MDTTMTTGYTARYRIEDGNWLAEIDEIPQVHTFGRTLSRTRAYIRDALGLWLQSDDPAQLRINERFDAMPTDLAALVSDAGESRTRANELSIRAQELTTVAANRLVNEVGLSTRDAAELLGVSHQRIHQLLQEQARSA
jgi:predicted RNase H-like HicB family nuclease